MQYNDCKNMCAWEYLIDKGRNPPPYPLAKALRFVYSFVCFFAHFYFFVFALFMCVSRRLLIGGWHLYREVQVFESPTWILV